MALNNIICIYFLHSHLFLNSTVDEEDPETDTRQIRRFSLRELQLATDNFSNKNVVNEFLNVYKGQLVDGSLVAVKRIDHKDNQVTELQFQREVEMISKVVHSNLVCLLGFCTTRKERLLVYPLMVNGSVARYSRGNLYQLFILYLCMCF